LGDGEAAVSETNTGRQRWTTMAAVLDWEKRRPCDPK
jgi:hypothetical protein